VASLPSVPAVQLGLAVDVLHDSLMGLGLGKALLEADQRVTDGATPEMAMRGATCSPAGRAVSGRGVTAGVGIGQVLLNAGPTAEAWVGE